MKLLKNLRILKNLNHLHRKSLLQHHLLKVIRRRKPLSKIKIETLGCKGKLPIHTL
jgi:hypothetical protein